VTRSRSALLGIFALLALACTSDPAESGDGAGGNGGGNTSAGSGGQPAKACPHGPGRETESDEVQVDLVTGQIVDEQGDPTSSGLVQVCGKNLCINAKVLDDGQLAEDVHDKMLAPACKFGNGKEWGKLAIPIGGGDSELGTLTAVRLPAFEDGAAFTPGQAVTSAGVTLTLSDDARVEIDTLTYEDESEFGFRAARLSGAALEQLGQDFAVAYALSPVETRICPSAALSLENSTDLPAGTELELFILGLDVLEVWAPYAAWEKIGEGAVSNDGQTLEFSEGLPLLTAIGVREKR
jgi:hypothetical protein